MRNEFPTPEAMAEFQRLTRLLLGDGVVAGNMFGAESLKFDGKAIACLSGDAMAFKLGREAPEHASALAVKGAELFDPSGMGRPFKDWVSVPAAELGSWEGLARAALLAAE